MNIFATHHHPVICAQNLDDKRVNKMTLETAQIICTVLNERGFTTPYKSTHSNQTVVRWAKEEDNFNWVLHHFWALANEYRVRYGKTHKCALLLVCIPQTNPGYLDTDIDFCNFARVKKDNLDFTHIPNTHRAYKLLLTHKWIKDKRKPKWTNRRMPEFFVKKFYGGEV
jgi:hypothetical protein